MASCHSWYSTFPVLLALCEGRGGFPSQMAVTWVTRNFDQGSFCGMCSAPKKRRYIVTSSFICWAHIQNDLCWRFLCSKPELAGEQTAKFPVNCNGVRVIWAEYRPHYSLLPKRLLNFRSLKINLTSGSRLRDFMRSHDKNLTLCVPSALSTVSSKI